MEGEGLGTGNTAGQWLRGHCIHERWVSRKHACNR